MLANYHTHTPRCQHATGSEKEYIETAIQKGFQTLGFSDHVPMPYPAGLRSGIRMDMKELDNYVDTLTALRKEYQKDIRILIGFETEYFPAYFDALMDKLRDYPIDYMIMGQHFLLDEFDGPYFGALTSDPDCLTCYVDQVIEGLSKGVFSYLAHPDLVPFRGDPDFYQKEMLRLIHFCNKHDIPLEINMLGFFGGRNYPCSEFFSLAAKEGSSFIIGCDAHNPGQIIQPEESPEFLDFLEQNHIRYSQELTLRPVK